MGAVYEAVDQTFNNRVALKQMFPNSNLTPQQIANVERAFDREAQILNRLRHAALPRPQQPPRPLLRRRSRLRRGGAQPPTDTPVPQRNTVKTQPDGTLAPLPATSTGVPLAGFVMLGLTLIIRMVRLYRERERI